MAPMQGLLGDLILMALATWVMAREMRRRPGASFFRPVMQGFIPVAMVSLIVFISLQRQDPEIVKFKESFVSQMTTAAMAIPDSKNALKIEDVRDFANWLLRLYPGLQSLFWLCALSVMAFPLRHWLIRKGLSRKTQPLSRWKAPDLAIWLVLIPAAILIVGKEGLAGEASPWLKDLCLNVLVVSLAIYVFQGAMVLTERLNRIGVPKPATVVALSVALLFGILAPGGGLGLLVLGLGLLETWMDFRNLNKKDTDKQRSA